MISINQKTIERCLQEIKTALKSKGLKYTDLAELLNVSTVTIKRILNQKDIGLDRLITLSELADLNIGELLEKAKDSPNPHHLFSDVQDKAFYENPHLFYYFSELFYFKKSITQIQQEHSISEVSTYRYLRKLEDIELITLLPENKINWLVKAPLGFSSNSLVLKKNITHHIESTCQAVMKSEKDDSYFMRVKPIRAPQTFFLQMAEELKKVVDRYAEIAEVAYISQTDLPEYQVTIVGHPLNITSNEDEQIIEVESFK